MQPLVALSCVELITVFQSKAACSYTQSVASRVWNLLERKLTENERHMLSVAWSHYRIGEGRGELDAVCRELCRRYTR